MDSLRSIVTELRTHQRLLLDRVITRLSGASAPLPTLTLDELKLAGLASGLTALIAHFDGDDDSIDPAQLAVTSWLVEQRAQVAARVDRFRAIVPQVRRALADADVVAVAVKGAELIEGIWPTPSARPMADIDLIIPTRFRAQAASVLQRHGLALHTSTEYEDVFLAWGDGSIGRTDGESVAHNGRVEVHPGWSEFVHGYVLHGFDVERHASADPALTGGWRLRRPALAAHVIGHLASTVVRAEVRAVNVIDVVFLHRAGVDWAEVDRVLPEIDACLTGPGLWLVDAIAPGVVPRRMLAAQLDRLSSTARGTLRRTEPASVLRDPTQRTNFAWRQAFASGRRRVSVVDQMVWPHGSRGLRPTIERVISLCTARARR